MAALSQPRLGPYALIEVIEITATDSAALLDKWGHYLGACHRPYTMERHALLVHGEPVATTVSASTVSSTVRATDGRYWSRTEVVELARLAAADRWATRVMLRLWREVLAPAWPCWRVRAAVAYSQSYRHDGRIYRHDGWVCAREDAGGIGGGTWSTRREAGHPAFGAKRLWIYEYPTRAASDVEAAAR